MTLHAAAQANANRQPRVRVRLKKNLYGRNRAGIVGSAYKSVASWADDWWIVQWDGRRTAIGCLAGDLEFIETSAPLSGERAQRCNVTGVVLRPAGAWERNRERQRRYRERVRASAAKTLAETVAADG